MLVSTDYTTSRPAVGTDRARTKAFDHALFHGGELPRAGRRWRAEVRTESDEDQVFFPADRAVANVPLAHQAGTCRYLPQDGEEGSQQGNTSASSTNRTRAAEVVDGFMGHWSFLCAFFKESAMWPSRRFAPAGIIQAQCVTN